MGTVPCCTTSTLYLQYSPQPLTIQADLPTLRAPASLPSRAAILHRSSLPRLRPRLLQSKYCKHVIMTIHCRYVAQPAATTRAVGVGDRRGLTVPLCEHWWVPPPSIACQAAGAAGGYSATPTPSALPEWARSLGACNCRPAVSSSPCLPACVAK